MNKLLSILLLSAFSAGAANICVGPTSAGSGDGSNWDNKAQWSSVTLTRGNVYFFEDGNYSSRNLNTANSGSTLITLKKAISSDHGSDTGWSSGMGDGQANFTGTFTITSSYWVFDGQTGGGPGSWTSGHGFKVTAGVAFYANTAVGNLTIQHTEFAGPGQDGNCSQNIEFRVFSGSVPNITLRYNYHHDMSSSVLWINGATDLLWEYNYVADSPTAGDCHGEAVYMTSSERAVFRYSMWRNVEGTGVIMVSGDDFKIYGNVIWWDGVDDGTSNGSIGGWSHDTTPTYNAQVYNNTIVDGKGFNSGIAFFSPNVGGNIVRNNLMVGNDTAYISGAQTVNNNTIDNTTSRFVNYAGRDFHLTGPLTGASLDAEFNSDLEGTTRGADEVWDRGAYEYDDSDPLPPTISSGDANGTNGIAFTYSIMASASPTNYTASNLPTGLTVNTNTGAITGTPSVLTTNTVTLTATNAYGGTNKSVTFTIWETQPWLGVAPTNLAFGYVATNYTSNMVFTVTNSSGAGTLTGEASTAAPFSIVGDGSYSLASGQTKEVTVQYAPTAVGSDVGSVTFTGGGGGELEVAGYGYPIIPVNTEFSLTSALLVSPMESNSLNSIWQQVEPGFDYNGLAMVGFVASYAGTVKVKVTGISTNFANNSFFVALNTPPTITDIWDIIPLLTNFSNIGYVNLRGNGTAEDPQFDTNVWAATQGLNTFWIRGREYWTRLETLTFEYETTNRRSAMNVNNLWIR